MAKTEDKDLSGSKGAVGQNGIKEGPFDPGAVEFEADLTTDANAPLPDPGDGSYQGGGRDERRRQRLSGKHALPSNASDAGPGTGGMFKSEETGREGPGSGPLIKDQKPTL